MRYVIAGFVTGEPELHFASPLAEDGYVTQDINEAMVYYSSLHGDPEVNVKGCNLSNTYYVEVRLDYLGILQVGGVVLYVKDLTSATLTKFEEEAQVFNRPIGSDFLEVVAKRLKISPDKFRSFEKITRLD